MEVALRPHGLTPPRHRVLTVLARDPDLTMLIDALDIVFLNEREATLYGRDTPAFWRQRRSLIVIKRGADGSSVIAADGEHSAPAPRVTPVDTTGAGDAFNAGFLVCRTTFTRRLRR